jgi:hypothetical protein
MCGVKIAVWFVLYGLDGTGGRRPGVAGLAAVCLPEIGGSAVRDRQTQTALIPPNLDAKAETLRVNSNP